MSGTTRERVKGGSAVPVRKDGTAGTTPCPVPGTGSQPGTARNDQTDAERAASRLAAALATLVDHGQIPPCAGHDAWTSDRVDKRTAAARLCVGCPLFAERGEYADAADERHHVWGGRDRTRTSGKARRSA